MNITMPYPTTFTDTPVSLDDFELDQVGTAAIEKLRQRGFEVVTGVRPEDVPFITEIAKQQAVREFCPKDLANRFGDREMMEQWLRKNGGRAVFLLRDIEHKQVRGYGWTGLQPCEELPEYTTTFGVRLDERVSGQGLGTPFVAALLSGSMAAYGTERVWGETWGSNIGAVKTYLRIGAVLVGTKDDWRPTLETAPGVVEGMRQDVRLLMKFPQTVV
jgi:RimJ/RimL family protein N-acetyltransferase